MLRRNRLAPLVLFALAACTTEAPRTGDSQLTPAGWTVLRADDSLRVELDTTGLAWRSGRATLWIAFTDVRGEREGKVAAPFLRFETRQDVNCIMRIARGLQVRTPDSTGTVNVHPIRDTSWVLFRDHSLGEQLLNDLCRSMSQP